MTDPRLVSGRGSLSEVDLDALEDEPCGHPCEDYFANFGECECTVYGSYKAALLARQRAQAEPRLIAKDRKSEISETDRG